MNRLIVRRFFITPFRLSLFFGLMFCHEADRLAMAQDLPTGVSLDTAGETGPLPLGYEAQILTVDWSHPLLKVSVVNGLGQNGFTPESWTRAEAANPESLRIQLIEPELDGETWRLALPLKTFGVSPDLPDTPAVVVGSLFPWRLLGAGRGDPRQTLTPGPLGGLAIGVRWMGDASQLDSMPEIVLDRRVLISWTAASAGQTRYALVVHTSPEAALVGDLRDWLKAQLKSDDRVAIHAMGERAIVGMEEWRMSAPSDPRRDERMGGVLVLSPRQKGDPVDWLRLEGSRLECSSLEEGFFSDLVTAGYGGPDPLDPRLWISRTSEEGESIHWLLAEFEQPRPITQVTMAWAQMAGWSAQFNPGRVRLEAMGKPGDAWATLAVFEDVRQPVSLWRADSPRPIQQMRLVFDRPSRMGLDTRARVALWQAWGPWDGVTSAGY